MIHFIRRPYVRLKEYDIGGEDRENLLWKLRTAKRGGCNGEHCHDRTNFISYRCAHVLHLHHLTRTPPPLACMHQPKLCGTKSACELTYS